MSTSSARYTAKLVDGPHEGRTVTMHLLDDGSPRPTVEIPGADGARAIYARGAAAEFDPESGGAPSAIEYRFLRTAYDG